MLVPGWLCHLEDLWTHPAAQSTRDKLTRAHRFVWYDRLGCGLSDRAGFAMSIDNDVEQLVAVLDGAGIERASLIGYSFGGPAAIVFAARYPQRVERLVLYGTFCQGSALGSDEALEATKTLMQTSWSLGTRWFASMFLPNGSASDLRWFSRFQRRAATADMAIRLLSYGQTIDVRDSLYAVAAPTLVAHNVRDPAVPNASARTIAAGIPGSKLLLLEGNEHEPFIRDSGVLVEAILAFVEGREPEAAHPPSALSPLTAREREVLRLIAAGESNKAIAASLSIRPATVERHVTNIYGKIGARGRADAVLHAVSIGLVPVPA